MPTVLAKRSSSAWSAESRLTAGRPPHAGDPYMVLAPPSPFVPSSSASSPSCHRCRPGSLHPGDPLPAASTRKSPRKVMPMSRRAMGGWSLPPSCAVAPVSSSQSRRHNRCDHAVRPRHDRRRRAGPAGPGDPLRRQPRRHPAGDLPSRTGRGRRDAGARERSGPQRSATRPSPSTTSRTSRAAPDTDMPCMP